MQTVSNKKGHGTYVNPGAIFAQINAESLAGRTARERNVFHESQQTEDSHAMEKKGEGGNAKTT